MNVCRVLGTVVATEKHPAYAGRKILVVQPLDELKQPLGKSFLAIDNISGAGKGDLVLVMNEGGGARKAVGADAISPIRCLIVGVVDSVSVS
jgi:microcompartment protein CcmK/EutM